MSITCRTCGQAFPRFGSIPILLPDPDAYLSSCVDEIAAFEDHAATTVAMIEQERRAPDAGAARPLAVRRCERMIAAVSQQVADVRALLEPVLSGAWARRTSSHTPSGGRLGPLRHAHYLFRDWGWPRETDGENERALALARAVIGDRSLGRTVVLGAGACRLAYDLHRAAGADETLVVDLDPLLLIVAQTVVRGGRVPFHEANAEIDEMDRVSGRWMLEAPDGPLDEAVFQFAIADALAPPLEPGVFDTVVTPWFIDLVPDDLRDFMSTVFTLLKPGGRWVSLGPLRYSADRAIGLRFTREEVFDLADLAGFAIDRWQSESQPYLVSKLSLRGKIEWVLAFAATKREDGPHAESSPPAWLLFGHLPVPAFDGLSAVATGDPVRRAVLSGIDGRRTLGDLAGIVAPLAPAGTSSADVRRAVRRYLAEIHPAARAAR